MWDARCESGRGIQPRTPVCHVRGPSQGSTEESVKPASEELMDAMQEDFEGTQVRRKTRRRVLSDDDLPLAQVQQGVSKGGVGPRSFR